MRIGIYCRISKIKEGNDLSILDQRERGIEKAKELGMQHEIYVDEGISGAGDNISDRPAFSKLLEDITNGKLNAVFAYDQSRFERNPSIRFFINDLFKKHSITYYTYIDGLVNLNDPQAEFFGDLLSVINKYHVTLTKIKVKSALRTRVKSGKAHSILPYGYGKNKDNELIVDAEEASIVEKIYDMSLSGIGTRSIAFYLNENNVKTRYNKIAKGTLTVKNKYTGKLSTKEKKDIKWEGNTVRDIIKNPIYKGVRIWAGESYVSPVIIDPNKWKIVNDNLLNNRNNTGKQNEYPYLLKGLIRCGVCGRNMYGRTRMNKKDHYYMCSSKRIKGNSCTNRSINIDRLDALIWDRFFKEKDFLNKVKEQFDNPDPKLDQLRRKKAEFEKRINEVIKEKDKVIDLVIRDIIKEDDAKNVIDEKNKLLTELNKRFNEIIEHIRNIEESIIKLDNLETDFETFSRMTSFKDKQSILKEFIKDIVVLYNKNYESYNINVIFNINIPNEEYTTVNNFNFVLLNGEFIIPKTISKTIFEEPKVLWVDASNGNVTMLGGDDSVPFYFDNEGFHVRVYNTKVPYGDVNDWTEDEISYFAENYPELYCGESGVSLASRNPDHESYIIAREEHQKKINSKSIPPQ